jgi:hypothetical protein
MVFVKENASMITPILPDLEQKHEGLTEEYFRQAFTPTLTFLDRG